MVNSFNMKSFLLVFLGGGIGSSCRFLISNILNYNFKSFHYLGTFSVNMIGCILIGIVMGFLQKENNFNQNYLLLFSSGFCGGFTTFSAFANENLDLIKNGNFSVFFLYVISSVVFGIAAAFLGYLIVK